MSARVKTWPAVPGGRIMRRTFALRHVAADERDVLHAGNADVGNEHAVAKEMPGILLAQHARSDPTVGGRRNGHVRLLFPLATFAANLPCGTRWHKRRANLPKSWSNWAVSGH